MRRLYLGYISPYSRKIRVVLDELGLDYEPYELHFAEADPSFNEVNPARRVPALVDGELTLFESNVIIDYLLETYRPGPASAAAPPPFANAMIRPDHRWNDWQILMAIETLIDSGLILLQMRNNGITPNDSEYLARELNRGGVLLNWLEARASSAGFVPGTFSVLDMNMVIALEWSDYRSMFEWKGRTNLEAIVGLYTDRPSMRTSRPAVRPD